MEFNPANPIIQLCIQGMELEEKGKAGEASSIFLQAWNESTNDFEKFTSAYYVARHQGTVRDKLKWLETSLQFALKINDVTVTGAYRSHAPLRIVGEVTDWIRQTPEQVKGWQQKLATSKKEIIN